MSISLRMGEPTARAVESIETHLFVSFPLARYLFLATEDGQQALRDNVALQQSVIHTHSRVSRPAALTHKWSFLFVTLETESVAAAWICCQRTSLRTSSPGLMFPTLLQAAMVRRRGSLGVSLAALTLPPPSLSFPGTRGEGWFDPHTLLRALRRKAQSLGVQYVSGVVGMLLQHTLVLTFVPPGTWMARWWVWTLMAASRPQ